MKQLDNIVRMKLQKLPLWKYVGVVVFFVLAVEADVISYNSSISSCEKAGHWKEALCLFVDLLEQRMNFGCKRVKVEGWKVALMEQVWTVEVFDKCEAWEHED